MAKDSSAIIKYFVMTLGNTMDSHKTFLDRLTISTNFRKVNEPKDSGVIIAFVPIVSRAGTDILNAMEKIPYEKPVVLVALHHTFDPEFVTPDTRLHVNRSNMFAVDCLFDEEQGLLRCLRNDEAIKAVKNQLLKTNFPEVDHNSHGTYGSCLSKKWLAIAILSGVLSCVVLSFVLGPVGVAAGVFMGVGVYVIFIFAKSSKYQRSLYQTLFS